MLIAVNNGAGSMAQFNCPELGGSGQWMRGGMTMVGDMFNHSLKSTVDSLCNELSALLANTQVFPPGSSSGHNTHQWWPAGMGVPGSTGSQNNSRYAVFPHRLVVESGGQVTVYDTLDHQINGVSQQQGSDSTLTFRSQHGLVSLKTLPRISAAKDARTFEEPDTEDSGAQHASAAQTSDASQASLAEASNTPVDIELVQPIDEAEGQPTAESQGTPERDSPDNDDPTGVNSHTSQRSSTESAIDILSLIEKLAQLHSAGVLSDDEFNAKKQELLARI